MVGPNRTYHFSRIHIVILKPFFLLGHDDTKILGLYPSQYTKNYDFYVTVMCTWLYRSNYYGPMHWTRRDGIATAIQRGRDLGVPPLNTVLRHYSQPVMDWAIWASKTDPKVS